MYNELYKILNYNDKKDNNDKKLHKKVDDEQSKTNLCIFLTHDFKPVFLKKIKEIDKIYNDKDIIILCDNSKNNNKRLIDDINNVLNHIKVIETSLIQNSSYDKYGHTMYIKYFKENKLLLNRYKYFWIIENDTYINMDFHNFINSYNLNKQELLVPEIGLRDNSWCHILSLKGFKKIYNIGATCCILRLNHIFLKDIIDELDIKYKGYLEAFLPNLIHEKNYEMNTFKPEDIGIVNVYGGPLIDIIIKDIKSNTSNYIEHKIYHPIKL